MNQSQLEEIREYTTAINNMLRLKDPGGVMWLLSNIPRSIAPHVKHIIEKNKAVILKYIVDKIKTYGFLDSLVLMSIDGLDTARIEWPELVIIKKSIRAEEELLIASNRSRRLANEP